MKRKYEITYISGVSKTTELTSLQLYDLIHLTKVRGIKTYKAPKKTKGK